MNSLTWIIAALGLAALIGTFLKMQGGFGPFNLRVVTIVLVATFVSLLASRDAGPPTAAIGILGAIVGYVFGIKEK